MAEDFPYEELDPGIRELVKLLHDNGWSTMDSGDGVTKLQDGDDHPGVLPFPHVVGPLPADIGVREAAHALQELMDGNECGHGFYVDIAYSLQHGLKAPALVTYALTHKQGMIDDLVAQGVTEKVSDG